MINLPEDVVKIIEEATMRHLNSIEDAKDEAKALIQGLSTFNDLVENILDKAVLEWVYDVRHTNNVKIKNATGYYTGANRRRKVSTTSDGVLAAYQSVYDYCISGCRLGDVLGKDLDRISRSEEAIASGHIFNARLTEWIRSEFDRKRIGKDRPVREAVPERELRVRFDTLYREVMGGGGDSGPESVAS